MLNSTRTTLSDVLPTIETMEKLHKYMLIVLYIIGMCGACLNMITFLQKQLRINPCGVYFFSTSIVDFGIMNMFILMDIIGAFDESLSNQIQITRMWCKVGYFFKFILPCLSSTYLTLASIDRFCISSPNLALRQWSTLKISRIVVISVLIFWTLFGLHLPILYDVTPHSVTLRPYCQVTMGPSTIVLIIDGFLFSLFNGAIIPFITCIFGLLIYYNIKRSQNHVYPQQNTQITISTIVPVNRIRIIRTHHSSNMLCMLLVQVFSTILLHIPFMVIYLMHYVNNIPKDLVYAMIFFIFQHIAFWFYYLNYCKTFYINTLTSRLFRRILREQFSKLFFEQTFRRNPNK